MRIGKKMKAAAVAVFALLLAGCSCAGKNVYFSTGLSKNEVFKINGSPCKLSESMLFLTSEKNLYENSYGSEIWTKDIAGMTFEEYVKNNVKSDLAEMKTMTLLAREKKIKLTEEELQKTRQIAETYYNGLSPAEIEYMNVKQDTVEDVYQQYYLAKKVYNELTREVNPEISDADAKIIKVQGIYAKTYVINHEGQRIEYTDEEKGRVRSDMEELLQEIPIMTEVKAALISKEGKAGRLYELLLCYERAEWNEIKIIADELGLQTNQMAQIYMECVEEVNDIWDNVVGVKEEE